MRFPLEVFRAVRAVWPAEKPISVRISANDWVGDRRHHAGGRRRHRAHAARRRASTSSTCRPARPRIDARPVYGRMFQTPFSDRIRNEVGIATMAVGNIYEPDHVNSILMAGRADLCCLARPHLADPYWTLHAAARARLHGRDLAQALSGRPRPAATGWPRAPSRQRRRCDGRARRQACADHRRRHRHRRGHRRARWRAPAPPSPRRPPRRAAARRSRRRLPRAKAIVADVTSEADTRGDGGGRARRARPHRHPDRQRRRRRERALRPASTWRTGSACSTST